METERAFWGVAVCIIVGAMPILPACDESVTVEAESVISVDLRGGECHAVSPSVVGYSPKWSGVTNAGAYVVLEKVEHVDTLTATTNTIATFAANAESEYALTVGDGDERCLRLVHRVYSADGEEIGEPLVRDVSFGYRSASGAPFFFDSRTNSLQEAVDSGNRMKLAYSTAWATNVAAVSILAVRISGEGGTPLATNAVFSADAEAKGETPMHGVMRGWWRLLFQVTDGSDNVLLEYLTDEFKMKGGFILSVR